MPKATSTAPKLKTQPYSTPNSTAKKDTSIDDIFSSAKGKGKASDSSARPPSDSPPQEVKSKPKSKKKAKESEASQSVAAGATSSSVITASKKQPLLPQVVVHDPSAKIETTVRKNRQKSIVDPPKDQKAFEDHVKFTDSRGTDPRRKTEEGFLIYKEDELGINDNGGDTPLCPFDCECCF